VRRAVPVFLLIAAALAAQTTPVRVVARANGVLSLEVHADPGARVAAIVGGALAADGKGLALDDPLAKASLRELSLRGTAGDDGRFRTRMLIDPPLLDRLAGRLYVQGATLLPNDAGCGALSPVVAVDLERPGPWPAVLWLAAAAAALGLLAFLPGAARSRAAGAVALAALAATPVLLAIAYREQFLAAPPAPAPGAPEALARIAAWLPPAIAALLFAARRALPSFGTACALLGLAIACVPAWLGRAPFDPAAVANAASILLLLDLAGISPRARLLTGLAQAAVVLAYPITRLAWAGPGALPLAASLVGLGVAAIAVRKPWSAMAAVLFLGSTAVAAVALSSSLDFPRPGLPDVRRVPTVLRAVWEAPGWRALALPCAAAIAVAALLWRRNQEAARPRALAVAAAAGALAAVLPIAWLLGTTGFLPTELLVRLDGIFAASVPACLLVAVFAAGWRDPPAGSVEGVGGGGRGRGPGSGRDEVEGEAEQVER
jgi:hypothetical protein